MIFYSDSDLCTYFTADPVDRNGQKNYVMQQWQYAEIKIHIQCNKEAESDEDKILEIKGETIITTTGQSIKYAKDKQLYSWQKMMWKA